MNSTDKAYRRDCFILDLLDSSCRMQPSGDISDYDEAIQDYKMLLDDAILRNDKREMSQLRKEIQQCRAEKRILKRMIDTIQKEQETATT